MSGGSARTMRNFSLDLWQDLVLHGIRKSSFQHLTVNWNFNVLEMAFETLHFVQGLSRTPLLFFPQHLCFGYPFFLSLSDVAVMLDLVNFRPSVPQTDYCYCYCCFFAGSAAAKRKRKEKKRQISEKLKTQRQERSTPLHFQKSQKNLKTHNQLKHQLQNRLKIH